jgi:hypothetical protein
MLLRRSVLAPLLGVMMLVSLATASFSDNANTYVNPNADGYIMDTGTVHTGSYLMTGADRRGIVEFSMRTIEGPISHAELSLIPYSLPLLGNPLQVYGYTSTDGVLTVDDYSRGTYLGSWTLPELWTEGAPGTTFDVTQFLRGVTTTYAGFNLRADGVNSFSSLEFNYGRTAQLIITNGEVIPEPASCAAMLAGFGVLASAMRFRRKR